MPAGVILTGLSLRPLEHRMAHPCTGAVASRLHLLLLLLLVLLLLAALLTEPQPPADLLPPVLLPGLPQPSTVLARLAGLMLLSLQRPLGPWQGPPQAEPPQWQQLLLRHASSQWLVLLLTRSRGAHAADRAASAPLPAAACAVLKPLLQTAACWVWVPAAAAACRRSALAAMSTAPAASCRLIRSLKCCRRPWLLQLQSFGLPRMRRLRPSSVSASEPRSC